MAQIRCPKCKFIQTADGMPAGTIMPCVGCGSKLRVTAAKPASKSSNLPDPLPATDPSTDPAQAIAVQPRIMPLPLDNHALEETVAPRGAVTSAALPAGRPSGWENVDEESPSDRDVVVLSELEKLQNQRQSWVVAIVLLVVSALMYMAVVHVQDAFISLLILVPLLAFHELGHYVTMRAFGYRNLRMFFIPFFGAAVSGQHYNIEGWKKAVVALAGPLPGILVGVPIGIAGVIFGEATAIEAAFLMMFLNGLNLLPFLPLDGGRVVQAVLFARHPSLDAVFRVVAALAMIGLGVLMNFNWFLMLLGVFSLLAAPLSWRIARIAFGLREEGLIAHSIDSDSIPTEAALPILAKVRRAVAPNTPPKMLAQHVANVFETLNAHPPGILVSLLLLFLHAGSFIVAFVMFVFLAFVKQRPA